MISFPAAFVKKKSRQQKAAAKWQMVCLFLAEGLAVGTLIHGGIGLVGTYQDPVQGTIVLILAVVCTLLDGAFNALIGMKVHDKSLLLN